MLVEKSEQTIHVEGASSLWMHAPYKTPLLYLSLLLCSVLNGPAAKREINCMWLNVINKLLQYRDNKDPVAKAHTTPTPTV